MALPPDVHNLRGRWQARTPQGAAPRWETPLDLMMEVDPALRATPALQLINRAITDAFYTPGSRLIICMPPQEGKSTLVTKGGPLWALTRNPELRIAVACYGQDLADEFGRDMRNIIIANQGHEDTLDLGIRLPRDSRAASRWRLDGHRGGVTCVGLTGALTGRPADAVFIDDPLKNQEQADSIAYRDLGWSFWQSVAGPRLAPGAPVIVILTRWHEDDLAGRLMNAEDGHRWKLINIPALADHKPEQGETDPLGREPGVWLESARGRTPVEWEMIRVQSGSKIFASLYQGRPAPEQGTILLRKNWRYYPNPLWVQQADGSMFVPGTGQSIYVSWDMAFKDTKASDYVVGQVWLKRGPDAYLLDQVRDRMTFTETVHAAKALHAKWPQATAKLVEDKANGTAVLDTLRKSTPGLIPIEPKESKEARAHAVSPFIEAGNVHLPDPSIAPWIADFVNEAAAFPNSTHDDQVDACTQALQRIYLNRGAGDAWMEYMQQRIAEKNKGDTKQ
jgi:predicted phage terminase large subunit-like protein